MSKRILVLLVAFVGVFLLGSPAAWGHDATSKPVAEAEAPSADVVLAVRYLRAEATKADALAKIDRLRDYRVEAIAAQQTVAPGSAASRANQDRLDRLERKLAAEWTRWRRSNRRAYVAQQEATTATVELTSSIQPQEVLEPAPSEAQWEQLRQCEASGSYTIVSANGLYMGAYQFSQATWESVGGTGSPNQASPAEQDRRAQTLYEQRGSSPWPHCGSYL